ncbi:MAG: hypothetical protein P4L31_06170, partial [Candidatus Babeliales bacterium]|nr:hypothetical protein [Candidatus Babeliales bacterium]
KNEDLVFDIATGFNKHIGFPLSVDVSVGAFEWFTAGVHSGVIPFLKRNKCIRMKTDCNQSGLIKLAKGEAVVHLGPLWDVGGYLKADHLAGRLSFLFGYTFINQCADWVSPVECQFDAIIVNSDAGLQGWRMHTINFLAEYDFTNEGSMCGPRLGFLINAQVGGRKIFKTNMFGGDFGLDIAWGW